MILPNLLPASTEKTSTILKIESASESESRIALNILSKHSSTTNINKDTSNNLTAELQVSQEKIEDLILKLQNGLGSSVKIEKLPVVRMKKGSQDDIGW